MLKSHPISRRRFAIGSTALTAIGAAAIVATAPGAARSADGAPARTIVVQPGAAGPIVLVHGAPVAVGSAALPADFDGPAVCDHGPKPAPWAMVIKGQGGSPSYSVACDSAAAKTTRATYAEALGSLRGVRIMVAKQITPPLAETDRADALGAIDLSIVELQADLDKAD